MPSNQVLMLTEPLAHSVAADPATDFEIVGPWSVEGELGEWLERGGGQAIRVVLSSGIDRIDRDLMALLPALETIVVFGAGQDGIDLSEAARRRLLIDAAGATHAGDVAEHGVAAILALRRDLFAGDQWVRSGTWQTAGRIAGSRRLAGSRVGIVGLGHIGNECATRLAALGCTIVWWGPRAKPESPWPRAVSLLDLAEASDILVVAAFAHESSRGLIDASVIDALGADGMLVNLSRGFVVDEDALIRALITGCLGQASLDVFAEEPTPAARWRGVPNLLLSPHRAGDTREAFVALRTRAIRSVRAALSKADKL